MQSDVDAKQIDAKAKLMQRKIDAKQFEVKQKFKRRRCNRHDL
jgi:hypothetical protein